MKKFNKKYLISSLILANISFSGAVYAQENNNSGFNNIKAQIDQDLKEAEQVSSEDVDIGNKSKLLEKIKKDTEIANARLLLLEAKESYEEELAKISGEGEKDKEKEIKENLIKIDNFLKFEETYRASTFEEDMIDMNQDFDTKNVINYVSTQNSEGNNSSNENDDSIENSNFVYGEVYRSPLGDKYESNGNSFAKVGYSTLGQQVDPENKEEEENKKNNITKEELDTLLNQKFNSLLAKMEQEKSANNTNQPSEKEIRESFEKQQREGFKASIEEGLIIEPVTIVKTEEDEIELDVFVAYQRITKEIDSLKVGDSFSLNNDIRITLSEANDKHLLFNISAKRNEDSFNLDKKIYIEY